jgi:hypothetical protein
MLQMSDILALIAILISALSIWFSLRTHTESSATQTIRSQYEHFAKIVQAHLDHPQLGHLFTVPECYETVLKQVTDSIQDLSPQAKIRLKLQERAMAEYLFNEFEQAFYQIRRVRPRFDMRSRKFYGEVLDYFTHILLRNPRLLYEPSTIAFYKANVLYNRSFPLKFEPDSIGPFAELESNSGLVQPKSRRTTMVSTDKLIHSKRNGKLITKKGSFQKNGRST